MNWLDTPPCGRMDVKTNTDGLLVLEGPSAMTRVTGAGAAAFGTTFASIALTVARLPIPGPFRIIPIAFTAIGGGMAALGLGTAVAKCSVRIDRTGIEQRWRWGPMAEKTKTIAPADIRAIEIQSQVHSGTDGFGDTSTSVSYRVMVVTNDGAAHGLEEFGLSTQATMRKEQIERLLKP